MEEYKENTVEEPQTAEGVPETGQTQVTLSAEEKATLRGLNRYSIIGRYPGGAPITARAPILESIRLKVESKGLET